MATARKPEITVEQALSILGEHGISVHGKTVKTLIHEIDSNETIPCSPTHVLAPLIAETRKRAG